MQYHYPTPREAGVRIPAHLRKERFCAGFLHGLRGGQLDDVKYFRLSFREGFRAAKLYLREIRRQRGILNFPIQGRFRFRAVADTRH